MHVEVKSDEGDASGIEMHAVRHTLFFLALIYLAFVIYGSLVPLHFHAQEWGQALARFRDISYRNLGIGSRADWVANILLFIPLAFFWLGTLWPLGLLARSLATLVVVTACVALCVGIEFTQIFFPPRTVSLNDIVAECIGTVIGVAAWWVFGGKFARWYADWRNVREPSSFAERLAWVYVAVVFVYGVLPLDLTISVVEIFHKWREGKLNLIPFAALPAEPSLALYDLTMDVLMWVPLGFLWRISGVRSSMRTWGMTIGAASLLEFLQLFVYSRVTDVTEVITATLGGAVGVLLAVKFGAGMRQGREMQSANTTSEVARVMLPLAFALAWTCGLAVLFWYPFNFRTDGAFLRERLYNFMTRVPFEAYYYGTEFRAATEVLHKVLFFIPLGAILGLAVAQLRWTWRGFGTGIALVLIAFTALAIDIGRLALPEKNPDNIDVVLQLLGGAIGYVFVRLMASRRRMVRKSARTHSSNADQPIRTAQRVPRGSRGKS